MNDDRESGNATNNGLPAVLIEWPQEPGGIQKANRGEHLESLAMQSEHALAVAMSTIQSMACRVTQTMRDLESRTRPDEIEVDFGISLNAEAGALIARTSAEAHLKIRLT